MDDANDEHREVSVPFFCIGVTTCNQPDLLKKTLKSILAQTYIDFEVIVGNDYVDQPLSAEYLGIFDARIRYVNHPANLGEIENNNKLLSEASAPYFTWQTQDDVYAPSFLEKIASVLIRPDPPLCVYTGFDFISDGESSPAPASGINRDSVILTGRQFLEQYLKGTIRALGCTGVYDRRYLQQLGGVRQLSATHYAVYSEHLLLIQAGLLKRVGYIPENLVGYRIHEKSWGVTTTDAHLYEQAGLRLLLNALTICSQEPLCGDYESSIYALLKYVVADVLQRGRMQKGWYSRFRVIPFFGRLLGTMRENSVLEFKIRTTNAWVRVLPWVFWWALTKRGGDKAPASRSSERTRL